MTRIVGFNMLIRCPHCNTRYTLTAAQIGTQGRTLRCAKCDETWFQDALHESLDEAPPMPPQAFAGTHSDFVSFSDDLMAESKTSGITKAFFGAITLLIVLAGVAVGAQKALITAFPELSNVYAAIGLHSSQEDTEETATSTLSETGLIIPPAAISRTVLNENGQTVLVYKGIVQNTNSVEVLVPPVRIALLNAAGAELDAFPATVEKSKLTPGEETSWSCRFINPTIDNVAEHRVRFGSFKNETPASPSTPTE